MTVSAEMTAVIDTFDQETNRLAELVTTLQNAVKTGMTTEEVAAVQASLGGLATRLKGIGKDPDQPIPPGPIPEFRGRR